jgi:hypothetical protein
MVFWATILGHEYGHVWAMRRHGLHTPPASTSSRCSEVWQSGASCTPKLRTWRSPSWDLSLGSFQGLCWRSSPERTARVRLTSFNLLPVIPLDGSHVLQAILRPFAGRTGIFVSGFVLLGVLVALASSTTVGLLLALLICPPVDPVCPCQA